MSNIDYCNKCAITRTQYTFLRKAVPVSRSICYRYESPTQMSCKMTHESFLAAYEQALGLQSWDAIAPFIDDNACFVFSDGTHVGKPQIERAIRATFALIKDEKYRLENVQWIHVTGDCVLCTYQFFWSGWINGVMSHGSGRGTSLLVSDATGWKIRHEHLGPNAQ